MKNISNKIQKATLKVLIFIFVVVVIIFIGSFIYYDNINSKEDPRVLEAKNLQLQYEKGLESDQYGQALNLLDNMEDIYSRAPGYERSYEIGVILNNKASVYLVKLETDLLTLDQSALDKEKIINDLNIARELTTRAITNYDTWLKEMGNLSRDELMVKISPFFREDDDVFKGLDVEGIRTKRVEDLVAAQVETKRRLSVSYTNLGVIQRYSGQLEESKASYEKAIELWDRNYTAKDNLNTLMDLPREKRTLIDRLFPPERVDEKEAKVKEEK